MSRAAPSRPVQLHVIHDLGGGSAKWLRDFVEADTARTNLVLRSFTHDMSAGSGIALFADAASDTAIKSWTFAQPIAAAAASHAEYAAALREVVATHGVGAILVSSVIGHSLDALDTGLPTAVVTHDFFPYTSTIHLHRGDDPRFDPFVGFSAAERQRVRDRFLELVASRKVRVVVPSASAGESLRSLDPRLAGIDLHVIPHGEGHIVARLPYPKPAAGERLRVLVPGQLSLAKGSELLGAAIADITRFADVFLLGSHELGEPFRNLPHVDVIPRYERGDLAVHVGNIRPHVGLLMSIVPETFSYALSELLMMGVPAAATRLGSFAERIVHGQNGYLFEPDAMAMVGALRAIDADRAGLVRVAANIGAWAPRPASDMVADYHRLLPLAVTANAGGVAPSAADARAAAAALTIADLWRQVKNLSLQHGLMNEDRQRLIDARAASEKRAEKERQKLEDRVMRLGRELAEREVAILHRDHQIQALTHDLHVTRARLEELEGSTAWKLTAPLRAAGIFMPKVRVLVRVAIATLKTPHTIPARIYRLRESWRQGGYAEFKRTLMGMQSFTPPASVFRDWRRRFDAEVKPRIAIRIGQMPIRPVISVLVPVYNTPETMLREMLDSVLRQMYPAWELCIADDASTEPHVKAVLQEYAARDKRVKLHLGTANAGVSHASNRALELATGDYVALLDHDDLLEPQALYRVAEAAVADDADIVYSDEVLVGPDGESLLRFTFRPEFSREYLRSHPYIVHLVAFRASILRDIGGFDEGLKISQDYDLILRAVERSKTVSHVAEVLYRWRQHGGSTGVDKREEVMATSKKILERHLERCGEAATVTEGRIFNHFDIRYPLQPGLKVAIVIPTKNHGGLLRQCIQSIRKTVLEAQYDIVVVDHESDEAATQAYLASIADEVRVLRYEGKFNFSSINNFAVSQVAGPYTHYLFCNNDIEAIAPGWLERMLELAQHRDIGMVGGMLYYPDRKTIQHGGVCVGLYGAAEHYGKRVEDPEVQVNAGYSELLRVTHEVAAVTAACVLMRRDAFDEVGGFDESIAVGFGDVDLCLRSGRRGFRNVFCPQVELVHHESYTRGVSSTDPHPADSALFRLKWKDLLYWGDPYYNPGLSLHSTVWSIRTPLPCLYELPKRVVRHGDDGRDHWLAYGP